MKRPWAVILVAVLECAAGVLALAVSISLFRPGSRLDRMWELNPQAGAALASSARPVAVLLLLVGLLAATAGVGLLTRRLWAWLLSLAIFGINALGDLVGLLIVRDWTKGFAGILIDGILIYLLLLANVRGYFLRRT